MSRTNTLRRGLGAFFVMQGLPSSILVVVALAQGEVSVELLIISALSFVFLAIGLVAIFARD